MSQQHHIGGKISASSLRLVGSFGTPTARQRSKGARHVGREREDRRRARTSRGISSSDGDVEGHDDGRTSRGTGSTTRTSRLRGSQARADEPEAIARAGRAPDEQLEIRAWPGQTRRAPVFVPMQARPTRRASSVARGYATAEPREHRFERLEQPQRRHVVLGALEQRRDPRDDRLAALASLRDRPRAARRLQQVEADRGLVREQDQEVDLAERERPVLSSGRAPAARRAPSRR